MRVPSIGLPLDERLIIREGYRWAERALRGYRDPPSLAERFAKGVADARQAIRNFYWMLVRG